MLLLMFVFTIVAAVASAVDAPIPVAAGVVSADAVNIGGTGVGLVVVASAASVAGLPALPAACLAELHAVFIRFSCCL